MSDARCLDVDACVAPANVFVSFELTCHMVERIKAGNSKENLQREVESNTITRTTEATQKSYKFYFTGIFLGSDLLADRSSGDDGGLHKELIRISAKSSSSFFRRILIAPKYE